LRFIALTGFSQEACQLYLVMPLLRGGTTKQSAQASYVSVRVNYAVIPGRDPESVVAGLWKLL
jgi:hypothetical protein